MTNSDRGRRRDNNGPKQKPNSRVNRSQSKNEISQGRRQDDTGTEQSEPNITRQNRGNRQNVSNQSSQQREGNDQL